MTVSRNWELADFHPGTAHLHDCSATATSDNPCDLDCANILYSMHERMAVVMAEWDVLSKGPSPTTVRLREARDG